MSDSKGKMGSDGAILPPERFLDGAVAGFVAVAPCFLLLWLAGCATTRPEIHEYPAYQVRVVYADPTSVNSLWRERNSKNDLGDTLHNDVEIAGFVRRQSDGWCEIWLSWKATMRTMWHELAHCDGSRSDVAVRNEFPPRDDF